MTLKLFCSILKVILIGGVEMARYQMICRRASCGQFPHEFEAPNDKAARSSVCKLFGTKPPITRPKFSFFGGIELFCSNKKGKRTVKFDVPNSDGEITQIRPNDLIILT